MSETGLITNGGHAAEANFYPMLLQNVDAMKQIEAMASTFCASQTYGLKNKGDAMGMILSCMATNSTFHQFSLENHIIEGRPSRRAEFMLAEFQRLGGKVIWGERSKNRAAAKFAYDGQEFDEEFTIQDAARMVGDDKLSNKLSNWFKDPSAMLRWRLISRALRYICPAATGGFYTPEEIGEIEVTSKRSANSEESVAVRRKEHGIDETDTDEHYVDVESSAGAVSEVPVDVASASASLADADALAKDELATTLPAEQQPKPEPKPEPEVKPVSGDQEKIWAVQAEILTVGTERLSLLQDQVLASMRKMSDKDDIQTLTLAETEAIRDKFTDLADEQGV